MPYYEDRSEYVDAPGGETGLVNIGWIDPHQPFPQGHVDPTIAFKIGELYRRPVNRTRGFHACKLCSEHPIKEIVGIREELVVLGDAEIRVRGKGKTYVCPTLIYHYIIRHRYQPRDEFLEAVNADSEI